jgi:anti-sigma28 factor (negative regulator of flagellin synthesis)
MAKKAARAKKATVKASGPSKLTMEMPLNAARVKAIQRCIAKGTLRITIKKVDLSTGKLGEAWLYD